MPEKIRVAGIVNDSITDGPGLRLAIFMQGCNRHCPGCHNPSALNLEGGTGYAVDELWRLVEANPLLSGVTFSGGEPLLQAKALLPLARKIKDADISLAIYTGYTLEDIVRDNDAVVMDLIACADTLVDGPYLKDRHSLALAFRGSANQRILNAGQSLKNFAPVLEQSGGWLGLS